MENETRTVRERLRSVLRMNQEPEDRLWSIVIVLAVLVLGLGFLLVDIRLYLAEGRQLSYERTATDCLEIIIDDDRDFDFPNNCYGPQVVVHYPPEVCAGYFVDYPTCGAEWEEL